METENPSISTSPARIQELEPPSKKPKMSSTTSSGDEAAFTTATTDGDTPKPRRYKRRKIAIFFAYCGVGYQGMQKNPGAKTIEGDFEEALYHAGAVPEQDRGQPKRFDWARSARTDKGVSAVGQVVSGRFYVDPPGFIQRLNSNLSPQIRVFGFKRVTASFNAKKFCDRRRYVYLIPVFALDPSCHRDRESVLASLGSGNELVKCLECSDRGRKIVGLMGNKRVLEAKIDSQDSAHLGISSNGESALLSSVDKEGEHLKGGASLDGKGSEVEESSSIDVDPKAFVQSSISLDNEAALLSTEGKEKEKQQCNISLNGATDSIAASSEPGIGKERSRGDLNGCRNGEEGGKERKIQFKYGDEEKERFNRILQYYVGTHNFHNFTTRTKAEDPSANRYIVSFQANTTLTVEGIEFVKCEVVGQSFMLHQIRKMMGLAVAIMRNFASESIFETAFQQDVRINVPTAPEVGLYLDECLFTSYNNKWNDSHEEISMKDYAEEAEEFKLKHIYSHIANAEHKEGAVALWLHSLNYRNYPDLRPADGDVGVSTEGKSAGVSGDAGVSTKGESACVSDDAGASTAGKNTEAETLAMVDAPSIPA